MIFPYLLLLLLLIFAAFAMFCNVLLCLCYVLLSFPMFCIVFAMFCFVSGMFCYVLLCLRYLRYLFVMFCFVQAEIAVLGSGEGFSATAHRYALDALPWSPFGGTRTDGDEGKLQPYSKHSKT